MAELEDHPFRYQLANELHARPFPSIECPATLVFVAIKHDTRTDGDERAHLTALIDRYDAPHPQPGATHYSAPIGHHMLKWERHTEFTTYAAWRQGLPDRPFDPAEFEVFAPDWLANAPGKRMSSAIFRILPRPPETKLRQSLEEWFVHESAAISNVSDDTATIAGDFRIDPSGNMRFAVFSATGTDPRRIGRIVQHLCEIETYKSMSMLGFAEARDIGGQIGELDTRLAYLTDEMSRNSRPAEDILAPLLETSSDLEALSARAAFRFGATFAYEAIVSERIGALQETRISGRQTFREFMLRRYQPAMRTVNATNRRLEALAQRAARTCELLRTRVDVERSAQNQALLASMDRRADLQLRLQKTVEGLSVVAVSYYAVSLVSYLLYPLAGTAGLSSGSLKAIVTLPVVAIVWHLVLRVRKGLK